MNLKSNLHLLLLCLAVGVGVRVAYGLSARDLPLFQQPSGDAATYVQQAEDLRTQGLLAPRGEVYKQAPLYPGFLWAAGSLSLSLESVR